MRGIYSARWNVLLSKLPKKLNICGRVVKLRVTDMILNSSLYGEASYNPPSISLDPNIPKDMVFEVTLHEILHQIDEAHGGRFELNDDESKTKALAIALAPVIEQLRGYL